MSRNDEPVKVTLNFEVGYIHNSATTEEVDIDRAEWEAMTPAERTKLLDDMADEYMANVCSYGWHIDDSDDYAATEEG